MSAYRQFLILTFATRTAFAFSFATYVMFLLSRGASLLDISLINLSFMVAIAFAEVPTGIFADLLGRKRSFLISSLIMAGGLMVYFFSGNFWTFIAAEMITGIGLTFRSGALEAWAVDAVAESHADITNERIFSSAEIVKNAANILGGLTGAYLGDLDLAYPWLAGAILLILVFIYSSFAMREPVKVRPIAILSPFPAIKSILKRSFDYGLRKKLVMTLMMTTLVSAFFYQPLNMYWQPRFASIASGEIWILGWIWVLISGSLMTGSYLVRKLPSGIDRFLILAAAVAFNSIPIILASLYGNFIAVLLLFGIYEVARGLMEPIRFALINDEIPSSERATILSLNQVFMRLGAVLGLLVTGLIANKFSVSAAWIIASLAGLLNIPLFLSCRGKLKGD